MPKKMYATDERSTHVAGFIPVVPAGSVVPNRHDDSIRLALSERRSRRSRGRLAWNSCYLHRQSRAIVGGHATLGDWPLEIQPLGPGPVRWAEPTLRDWMRLFLAGALGRHPAAGLLGVGTRSRFVPRADRPGRHSVADSRLCRSQACASEMSESNGTTMAQKASKKLPLCATFLAFQGRSSQLEQDVFLDARSGGATRRKTRNENTIILSGFAAMS
jgi:hypothetical protein